jgi:hypothetical protein
LTPAPRDRNPYLLLGVDFGTSREAANVAFARKARALRRAGPEGRERLTELTWALNQIDEALVDPERAIDVYRIPADPDAFDPDGSGLFRPPPERLERRTPGSGEDMATLTWHSTREILIAFCSAYLQFRPPPPV